MSTGAESARNAGGARYQCLYHVPPECAVTLDRNHRSRSPEYAISALMFGGLPGALLDLALLKSFTTLTSDALLDELAEKLHGKFGVSMEDVGVIRARFAATAILVTPKETLHVITDDPDDNRVLECAISGDADIVVSGDRPLLTLGSYQGIPILRVRAFMERLEEGGE